MNVYQKLAKARKMLKEKGLKQSGENKFAGYKYFELEDIVPAITEIENEIGLISITSFTNEIATLRVFNSEVPEEVIVFTSPFSTASLKGCHEVQNVGAVETYQRRYLYNIAYDIVECDALNATQGKNETETSPQKSKQVKPVKSQGKGTAKDVEPVSEPIDCCICGNPCNNDQMNAWVDKTYPNLGRYVCSKPCWNEAKTHITKYEDGSVEWRD